MKKEKTVNIILGMHRSGTSLLAKIINDLGVSFSENLNDFGNDYVNGYFEDNFFIDQNKKIISRVNDDVDYGFLSDIKSLSEGLNYNDLYEKLILNIKNNYKNDIIWGFKDPRTSLTYRIWESLLGSDYNIQQIYIYRNPIDVAKSIMNRDGYPISFGLLLWYYYNLSIIEVINDDCIIISYEDLISNPMPTLNELSQLYNFDITNLDSIKNNIRTKKITYDENVLYEFGTFLKLCELFQDLEDLKRNKSKDKISSIIAKHDSFKIFKELSSLNQKISYDIKNKYKKIRCQLFYDDGSGYNEEKSIIRNINNSDAILDFEINHKNKIFKIRFDPCDEPCMIEFITCYVKTLNNEYKSIIFTDTNAFKYDEKFMYFITNDPKIEFNINENIKSIHFNLKFQSIGSGVLEKIYPNFINEINEYDIDNKNFEIVSINMKKHDLKNQEEKIQYLINKFESNVFNKYERDKESMIEIVSSELNTLNKKIEEINNANHVNNEKYSIITSDYKNLQEKNITLKKKLRKLKKQNIKNQESLKNDIEKNLIYVEKLKSEIQSNSELVKNLEKEKNKNLNLIENLENRYKEKLDLIEEMKNERDRNLEDTNKLKKSNDYLRSKLDNYNLKMLEYKSSEINNKLLSVNDLFNKLDASSRIEKELLREHKNKIKAIKRYYEESKSWKLTKGLRKINGYRHFINEIKLLQKSNLFDPVYYRNQAKKNGIKVRNPYFHYLRKWSESEINPSLKFSNEIYLDNNIDIKESGRNPLIHYLRFGINEGRSIKKIDQEIVIKKNEDLTNNKIIKNDKNIIDKINIIKKSKYFDEQYYLEKNKDLEPIKDKLVEHYILYGAYEGRSPSEKFDSQYYLEKNTDIKEAGINPLWHYITSGEKEGREPLNNEINQKEKIVDTEIKCLNNIENVNDYEEMNIFPIKVRNDDTKIISFYLPQFHLFPENEEWWGKGFNEWTNVTKGNSKYDNHYQPHLPTHFGFYDLKLVENIEKQFSLAKKFGIYGFCFHHYYFAGKRLMEKPVDNILNNPQIDINYCLCWANENWTRTWDGFENDVLIKQEHSDEDDIRFIEDIEKYFLDRRYIRVDNKPMLVIYRADIFPNINKTLKRWRRYWKNKHNQDLHIVMAQTFGLWDPREYGFDAAVQFPPHNIAAKDLSSDIGLYEDFKGKVYSYEDFALKSISLETKDYELYKTVMPSWDNTARRDNESTIFYGSTPDKFNYWLNETIKYTKKNLEYNNRFLFVNAWNEWAEGAHLEPCIKYGYSFLNKIGNTKYLENKFKISIIVPNYNHSNYLTKRLDSIFNQDYLNYEVILLDDNSTDDSQKILNLYNEKFKNCKLIINNKNSGGVFKQWKKGIEAANGDLIWIAESDDYCDHDFISKLVKAFDDPSVMLSYSNTIFIDKEGQEDLGYSFNDYISMFKNNKWKTSYINSSYKEVKENLGIINTIPNASSVIFRNPKNMDFINSKEWTNMKVVGDWYLYLNVIMGGKIAFISDTNNYYRRYSNNTSSQMYYKKDFYQEIKVIYSLLYNKYNISDKTINKSIDYFYELASKKQNLNKNDFYNSMRLKTEKNYMSIMISFFGFYNGGAELFPIHLANYFKKIGIPVILHSCNGCIPMENVKDNIDPSVPYFESKNVNEIEKVINDNNVTILNSHHWEFQKLLVDWDVGDINHIATLHGILENEDSGYNINKKDLYSVDKKVNKWIYTADKNIIKFNDYKIFNEKKFVKIINGVNNKLEKNISRESLNIPDDSFVFCIVSRAIIEKGWNQSIEIIRRCREKSNNDIHLILVGDGEVYENLKDSNNEKYVHLIGYDSRANDYYNISDMGMLLSNFKSESFPLTILNCLSVQKPFFSTNIGEIKKILSVDNEIAGKVVDLNSFEIDIDLATNVILNSILNKNKYNRMLENAKRLSEKYSIDNVGKMYIEEFMR